tara:strand:+ start:283 stop:1575 length:1293 start_codon:yes stop_codon:yes gene_type:complete
MEDLISSIEEVGLLQRLIINKKYQVLSGNRRLEAIQKLGWKEVDVEVVDTDENDELKLIVHYNKTRHKTCKELLNEVHILSPEFEVGKGARTDLTCVPQNTGGRARDKIANVIGISSSQIGKLLFIQKNDPHYIELIDDGVLTISQAYLTIARMKNQSNALEGKSNSNIETSDDFVFYKKSSYQMDELDESSIDCIFTSPPYWNKRNYVEGGGLGNEKTDKEFVSNLVSHLQDCKRVLKEEGSFFLVLGDTFNKGNLLNIPHRIAIALQEEGWVLRNTIIWHKTNPKPSSSKSNLSQTYEYIFHLVKSLNYNYNHTLGPLKHNYKIHAAPRHRDMKPTKKKMYPYIPRDGKNIGDYWSKDVVESAVAMNVSSNSSLEHPAPFPESIIKLPILQTTSPNDVILDLFMGRGTTGLVANSLGRRFIGYDIRVY